MKVSNYSMLCVLLLGFALLFMFIGFDYANFLAESVFHSLHDRDPANVNKFTGYYGRAISNVFCTIASLLTPLWLRFMTAKWAMVFGSLTFTLYSLCFITLSPFVYYVFSALHGIMFAVFFIGYNCYLTEISRREDLERNSALVWSIGSMSTMSGGLIYVGIYFLDPSETTSVIPTYRDYSDEEIKIFFGIFGLIGLLSNVLFACLPNKGVSEGLAVTGQTSLEGIPTLSEIKDELTSMFAAFWDTRILQICPHMLYVGLNVSTYLVIFPTAIQFTSAFASIPLLTAFYGIVFSIGSLIAGCLISFASKRVANFGLKPLLTIAVVVQTIVSLLIVFSIPGEATRAPTSDQAWLINPSAVIVLVIGFCFGALDSCNMTNRMVISTLARPEKRTHTFAVARFYHALVSSLIMLLSSRLSTYTSTAILTAVCYIGAILFWRVSTELLANEETAEAEFK